MVNSTSKKAVSVYAKGIEDALRELEIAVPVGRSMGQDEEWVVVNVDGQWKKVRLHDYGEVFSIPGLYEKWIYDVFECQSPARIRKVLWELMDAQHVDPESLVVLDLGAGNGIVAQEFKSVGVKGFVGVDIEPEAKVAADRDRPGLYADYIIGDLTALDDEQKKTLDKYDFNTMTCVAALGFGDIPTSVFAEAYNRVSNEGWVAFTIKTDFLDEADQTGFSKLMRRMMREGAMKVLKQETYPHRLATHGEPLLYDAIIGRKLGDIPADWIED